MPTRTNELGETRGNSKKRVVVVDDDEELRLALRAMIAATPDFHVVGSFPSGAEALLAINEIAADVLIIDAKMPGASGVDCANRLKISQPAVRILMISGFYEPQIVLDAFRSGAQGFLLKPILAAELIASLRELVVGGTPISSWVRSLLIDFIRQNSGPVRQTTMAPGSTNDRRHQLTKQILENLERGMSYKQIAVLINVSIPKIHKIIHRIYVALNAHNRSDAIQKWKALQ